MNCQEFRERIAETGPSADLLAHSGECQACAALLVRYRALEEGLTALAADLRRTEAPARVEAGLLAAFRSQQRPARREARHQWWIPALSWATAAAVVTVAALFLLHPHQSQPAHRNAPGAVELASISDSNDPATDQDDGFIALPNARKLDPNEDVNVVRVEVPRSAMLSVGLAVSADRVSELVEADVVLGADGLARAIRFVDEPVM
jgi:hypothetical protein